MPADAKTAQGSRSAIEPGPPPDSGEKAVGADDPARRDFALVRRHAIRLDPLNRGIPEQLDTGHLSPADERLVKVCPADAKPAGLRELPFGDEVAVHIS